MENMAGGDDDYGVGWGCLKVKDFELDHDETKERHNKIALQSLYSGDGNANYLQYRFNT